jgi:hypothetical protein
VVEVKVLVVGAAEHRKIEATVNDSVSLPVYAASKVHFLKAEREHISIIDKV